LSGQGRHQWKDLLKRGILEEDPAVLFPVKHAGATASQQSFDLHYHGEFQKECATSEVLTSLYSKRNSREKDRNWSFACSKILGVKLADCSWTSERLSYLGKEWTLGNYATVIVGIKSQRRHAIRRQTRDRTYAIKTCRVAGTEVLSLQQDADWVNHYDHQLSYTVAKHSFLMGITSNYSSQSEDRIWKFTTGRLFKVDAAQCSPMVHSGQRATFTGFVAQSNGKFEKVCGKGEVLTSIYSDRLGKKQNRMLSFSCGPAPGVELTECAWTKQNRNLLEVEWTLGTNERVIVGLKSAGRDADSPQTNQTKDRTYSIKSCKVIGLEVHAPITDADWANEYENLMSYTLPVVRFMTKITSQYSHQQDDRIFKFTTIQLCKPGEVLSHDFNDHPTPAKKTFEKEIALWEREDYTHVPEEVLHMKEDMKQIKVPWKQFSDFNKLSFNSSALLVPEQVLKTVVLPDKIENKLLEYVSEGGTLIVCGSGALWSPTGSGVNLINQFFGFRIARHGFEYGVAKAKKNATGCGLFCSVDEVVMYSSTQTVNTSSLPPHALVAFVKAGDSEASPIFTIPHRAGLIVYLGFDWFSSDRQTAWATLLKLAYDRNA